MNDSEKYILETIEIRVWSGFYSPDYVKEMVDNILEYNILEEDVDKTMLYSAVAVEFDKKAAAELLWPNETDCDRLDATFETLNANSIIALHNAGNTMSDGFSDVDGVIYDRGRENFKGYCFYHSQALECAVKGDGLSLAFGDLDDNEIETVKLGNLIKDVLKTNGFTVEWHGHPREKISIPTFDWKRRRYIA